MMVAFHFRADAPAYGAVWCRRFSRRSFNILSRQAMTFTSKFSSVTSSHTAIWLTRLLETRSCKLCSVTILENGAQWIMRSSQAYCFRRGIYVLAIVGLSNKLRLP